eukprot:TRINITY_DN176_c0_g1::TRINITY_DN176_c0_g1_i1::g.14221::m.14221 TRINITY_DN176_c0_g1::TRINITY_DN176_c0_g1_i1::g.14221  ORF type:complete len:1183 (-),score=385.96,sp/P98200/AT8A2_MOUSE/35.68/0.0,E1-E2_ATPase/PF00122.15/5.9e-19,HAD/PF12710.2/9.4e-15,Hydrolase/PF00702.21/1.3e-09,Hydrolase_like2/PF13246.1/5.3e-10,Hydrolase_3/PF08282.7/0.00032,Cation_ATPase_C/PF00689.16/3.5,Cation_ATPase_C/PF00689.16/3.1 TRINITY_DN176_c0_g1_i1:31-3282(-)
MAVPLAVVIGIQAVTTAIEDYRRHKADEAENKSSTHIVHRQTGNFHAVKWHEVKMGDIVKVERDQPVPADMVFLASQPMGEHGDNSLCYVTTAQLDGENSLKTRRAPKETADAIRDEADCHNLNISVTSEMPNKFINQFTGTLIVHGPDGDTKTLLDYDNILMRGSLLKNVRCAYGLVVNVGKETKVMQSLSKPRTKSSITDKVIENFLLRIIGFLLLLCFIAAIINTVWTENNRDGHWYLMLQEEEERKVAKFVIMFFTYFVILAQLLPISIYVSTNIVKVFQSRFINWDMGMMAVDEDGEEQYSTVRTMDLNDDLGQVAYVFADKTGTLTCNRMEFRKCWIRGRHYGMDTPNPHSRIFRSKHVNFIDDPNRSIFSDLTREGPQGEAVRFFILNAALNHSVIPDASGKERDTGDGIRVSASSPDEAALVHFAAHLGYQFQSRARDGTLKLTVAGQERDFLVLHTLEYTSERRRMSVLVREKLAPPSSAVYLFCKGADSELMARLSAVEKETAKPGVDALEEWSSCGLRTLVFGYRVLSHHDYAQWAQKYEEAQLDLEEVQKKKNLESNRITALEEEIERDFVLQGITAVEDKLQDGVPDTIEALRIGGIKVWMLTGDRTSTAKNIAFATRLLDPSMRILDLTIASQNNDAGKLRNRVEEECRRAIEEELALQNRVHMDAEELGEIRLAGKRAMLIDEGALDYLTSDELLCVELATVARNCVSVVGTRMRPDQKKTMVKLIYGKKDKVHRHQDVTLAIGDGANDVDMIQTAHVGVAILGKEGRQAANASDFVIPEFKALRRLLFVHGRWNHRRVARLLGYQFYKTFLFKLPQFWFSIWTGFSGQKLYIEMVEILYNVLFCTLPILCFGAYDRDVPIEAAEANPHLYHPGWKKDLVNNLTMRHWVVNATWQSLVCYFVPMLSLWGLYSTPAQGHLDIWELGAAVITPIVVVVNLKVLLEMHFKYWFGVAAIMLSILLWFICAFAIDGTPGELQGFFRHLAGHRAFWLVLFFTFVLCLLRDVLWKSMKRELWPTDYHIIQERVILSEMQPEAIPSKPASPALTPLTSANRDAEAEMMPIAQEHDV